VTTVVKHEAEAVPIHPPPRRQRSIVHADEARAWDDLHATFEMKRIDHGQAYSANGACTNQAESYFIRWAGGGVNIIISRARIVDQYAGEMAWREDMRRKPPVRSLTHVAALFSASTVTSLGWILAASSAKGGVTSSRVIAIRQRTP